MKIQLKIKEKFFISNLGQNNGKIVPAKNKLNLLPKTNGEILQEFNIILKHVWILPRLV